MEFFARLLEAFWWAKGSMKLAFLSRNQPREYTSTVLPLVRGKNWTPSPSLQPEWLNNDVSSIHLHLDSLGGKCR